MEEIRNWKYGGYSSLGISMHAVAMEATKFESRESKGPML
jgi:hypothetical protein